MTYRQNALPGQSMIPGVTAQLAGRRHEADVLIMTCRGWRATPVHKYIEEPPGLCNYDLDDCFKEVHASLVDRLTPYGEIEGVRIYVRDAHIIAQEKNWISAGYVDHSIVVAGKSVEQQLHRISGASTFIQQYATRRAAAYLPQENLQDIHKFIREVLDSR